MAYVIDPGRKALRKGRFSEPGRAYAITTVTDKRIPWFQVASFAQLLCRTVSDPAIVADARLMCWVVMPDHLHILLHAGEVDLSCVVKRLKGTSARALNREIGRAGRFWAPGFHDRAIRKSEDLRNVARYIVANPLRAGLVGYVGNYPYWDAVWLGARDDAIP